MLKTSIAVASVSLALATGARADHAHPQDDPAKKPPATGAMSENSACKMDMAPMREPMTRMRSEMEKIRATSDPKEKERLMEEHFKTMQRAMSKMQGMMGGGMMHGGMGQGAGPKPAN